MKVAGGEQDFPLLTVNFGEVNAVVAFICSMAIILGAVFVVFEISDKQEDDRGSD